MGLLKEGHVYSYSQLSSFDECKYGFYLQRIEGIQEQSSNAFAERGTLIHDLLDQWAKKILTKEDMVAEYERRYPDEVVSAWPRVLASKGYAKKAYNQGVEFLQSFDEFEGFEVIAAEEKFNIELPLTNGETRPFVGIVDMILREIKTGDLIINDHKSKSLTSFKKDQDKMYRQQFLYAPYILQKYGKFPDRMMFHLFNEGGLKPERLFSTEEYNKSLEWATKQILGIEENTILDWLVCKEKPDFYCTELCGARKECPNGVAQLGSRKRKDNEFESEDTE